MLIADSITKANLEAQINSLKSSDNTKRTELQKQLEDLKNNEAIRFAERKKEIDSLRLTAKGYPVFGFFNDTLFYIYNNSGSFSAEDRANAINNRIKTLSDNYKFAPDSIKIIPSEASTNLAFGDNIIMSISDNDALWENTTRSDLAEKYRKIIGNEVVKYRSDISLKTLAKEIALALLVIAITFFIIKYISKLFRWARVKIWQQKGKLIKGVQIKNYTLFDADSEVNALLNVIHVLNGY